MTRVFHIQSQMNPMSTPVALEICQVNGEVHYTAPVMADQGGTGRGLHFLYPSAARWCGQMTSVFTLQFHVNPSSTPIPFAM